MPSEKAILQYARRQADDLQAGMEWQRADSSSGGYWKVEVPQMRAQLIARAAAAQEFFRQYAGPDSFWCRQATSLYDNHGTNQSVESGVHAIGDLLRAWCEQVETKIVEIVGSRAWSELGVASTDVMSQVRRLIDDRDAAPAAPIVLCGAALEMALRALIQGRSVQMGNARPTLSGYTQALYAAQLLTKQDVKDLQQLAGLRNEAAHGHFDDLTMERAKLMEQQTNWMLRRLADLQLATPSQNIQQTT
ncbi:hypothetical protein [Nonomuraea sp. B1E8]|uniref:hypothetical protein n=1 Tax=unclassified Nonomuraea TaxID=2593643 RepID=UPI00325D2D75